jgi:hypothetical protein
VLNVIPPVVHVVISGGTNWPAIVAPLAAGVVGVAGIIGTAWQGKRGREAQSKDLQNSIAAAAENLQLTVAAEDRRAHVAEKRQVYAAYLAACVEVQRAIIKKNLPGTDAEKQMANLEYGTAAVALVAANAEVSYRA